MKAKNVFNKFSVFLILLVITVGCSPWKFGADRDVVKNGISFEAFREYSNGSKVGTLIEDTVIDGVPCRDSLFHGISLHFMLMKNRILG